MCLLPGDSTERTAPMALCTSLPRMPFSTASAPRSKTSQEMRAKRNACHQVKAKRGGEVRRVMGGERCKTCMS